MNVLNSEPNTPPFLIKRNLNRFQEKKEDSLLYDDEFIFLINGLNESIKEYYKVCRNNIIEANSFLSFYEEQGQATQSLMEEIINSNSYQRVNEVFEQIPKINDIMSQLQINTNSNEKNLNLFFEDAKLIFKKMKMKRKQKIIEMNSDNNQALNDSFSKSFNIQGTQKIEKNKFISNRNSRNKIPFNKINMSFSNSDQNLSILISINNIYIQIMKLINSFSDFNLIIGKINPQASNKYTNLQNDLKKELDTLINFVKSNIVSFNNQYKALKNKNLYNMMEEKNLNDKRSKSIGSVVSAEIEKLKKMNQLKEKKISELNNQLNLYKNNYKNINNEYDISQINTESENKIKELQIQINNLKLNLMNSEKQIQQKDKIIMSLQNNSNNNYNLNNSAFNMNNLVKLKDNEILNLQQQLYVYQNNENLLNSQITDLNNKFQEKINQYESQLFQISNKSASLSQIILNKNKDILKFKNENIENKKEIERLKKTINNQKLYNNKNINNNPSPIISEDTIQMLNNQINKYKNMINQYENKIFELSQNNNGININNNLDSQKINIQNRKIIEEQKMKINQLTKEILNYQKKEKINEENNIKYIKQIEEMNNNILSTNNIIEQKDDLIKQLNEKKDDGQCSGDNINLKKERDEYKFQLEQMQKKYISIKELLEEKNTNPQAPNNDMLKMKLTDMQLENERLRKEISELKILGNNNLVTHQLINQNNAQQNNSLIIKINELSIENQKYKDLFNKANEKVKTLEENIKKKNEEIEALNSVIFKLQTNLEKKDDNNMALIRNFKSGENVNVMKIDKKGNFISPSSPCAKDTAMINNILNKLNDAEKRITSLQKKNKELQFKLDEKQVEQELSGYKTEDVNFSNYEEEFDLKKMVNGARDKNRSEDINIDYPGVQGIKDKYKELLSKMNMLQEQVRILICNINCSNKIKPQITQICQIMGISAKNIQLIISGKDKKKILKIGD